MVAETYDNGGLHPSHVADRGVWLDRGLFLFWNAVKIRVGFLGHGAAGNCGCATLFRNSWCKKRVGNFTGEN